MDLILCTVCKHKTNCITFCAPFLFYSTTAIIYFISCSTIILFCILTTFQFYVHFICILCKIFKTLKSILLLLQHSICMCFLFCRWGNYKMIFLLACLQRYFLNLLYCTWIAMLRQHIPLHCVFLTQVLLLLISKCNNYCLSICIKCIYLFYSNYSH